MQDEALLRYSRHILLPEIGVEGQQRLLDGHALVIGAGGLGSAASVFLAASGVGKLTLCDHDSVDLTNLQRQIAHSENSLGINKAVSARRHARALNSQIVVEAIDQRLEGPLLDAQVALADVVVDASDNFATRHAVNQACSAFGKPLVSGAALGFDGQLSVFDTREPSNPCYHCLFPDAGLAEEPRCATNGVFAPLVGIIGSMQAAEALKILSGIGSRLIGALLLLDARTMDVRRVTYKKDSACPVCAVSARAGARA